VNASRAQRGNSPPLPVPARASLVRDFRRRGTGPIGQRHGGAVPTESQAAVKPASRAAEQCDLEMNSSGPMPPPEI
jgi:hypothetical protein